MINKTITQHHFTFLRRQLTAGIVAATLATGFFHSLAKAQDEASSSDTAAARELAVEGLKLADAGQCSEAIDRLTRADKLHHSPIVLGRLGECQIEVGNIVEGTEALRKLLREVLPANPPASVLVARDRAQKVLDAAKPRIANLNVSIQGPNQAVTVTIDGQLLSSALYDRDRPTDPGEHDIDATAPGYIKESRHVTLGPGEKQVVLLTLRQDPEYARTQGSNAAKASPAAVAAPSALPPIPAAAPPSAISTRHASGPNRTSSYVMWVLGGAAVTAGSAFGFIALTEKKDLDKQCVDNLCPAASKGALDTANRNATLSTILMGVGAAGLALGTVLFFTSDSSPSTENSSTSYQPRLRVGIGRVEVEGAF